MKQKILLLLAVPAWSTTLPLEFEGMSGRYLARASGYTALFAEGGVDLRNGPATVRLSWKGAAVTPAPTGRLRGVSNYLTGEPSQRRIGVPHYSHVAYRDVLPGVGVVFYGADNRIEFDWNIRPGADPRAIEMKLSGAGTLTIDSAGDLVAQTPWGALRQRKPVAWQQRGERRIPVQARFEIRGNQEFGFSVGAYDPTLPLTIDPVLGFVTNFGGNARDAITSVALTSAGEPVVAGYTDSGNMWNTGGFGDPVAGTEVAFFCKLNSTGTALYFCSFFGNVTRIDALQIDASDRIYAGGRTTNPITLANGPTLHPFKAAGDGFLALFNQTGTASLQWTYLGGTGTDWLQDIVLSGGNTYVTGTTYSNDFPVTAGAPQSTRNTSSCSCSDAFIAKLNSTWTQLLYSTYAGGEFNDSAQDLDVASDGSAVIAGSIIGGAGTQFYTTTFGSLGSNDGFVVKLAPSGGAFTLKAALGGSATAEALNAVAIDSNANIHACGYSRVNGIPLVSPWLQPSAGQRPWLIRISSLGQLTLSTPLADSSGQCLSMARRGSNLYLAGSTYSTSFGANFVSLDPLLAANSNVFLLKTNPLWNGAQYSTIIGSNGPALEAAPDGLVVSPSGPWMAGVLYNAPGGQPVGSFHTTTGVLQPSTNGGTSEGFLIRINESADLLTSVTAKTNTKLGVRYIDYTATVRNFGPDVADAVTLSASTPSGLTLVSATINGVNCKGSASSLSCAMGDLSSSSQVTAVVTYSVASYVFPGTSITMTMNAQSLVADPNTVNNSASVTIAAP